MEIISQTFWMVVSFGVMYWLGEWHRNPVRARIKICNFFSVCRQIFVFILTAAGNLLKQWVINRDLVGLALVIYGLTVATILIPINAQMNLIFITVAAMAAAYTGCAILVFSGFAIYSDLP